MSDDSPNFRWPWLLLVVFLLAGALALMWMLAEVKRVKRVRDLNTPPPTTATTRTN